MSYKPSSAPGFFQELLRNLPEFSNHYHEHVKFNDELLPYVLMDDFSTFLIAEIRKGFEHKQFDQDLVKRGVAFLDQIISSEDEEIATMIRTTFIETVETTWRDTAFFRHLLSTLTPALREQIAPHVLERGE
jgi:hypothetical protein